jgi:hypothetical protein
MEYRYDAELTQKSVRNMYLLPPLLVGGALYSAWLAREAKRTHTEIYLGGGSYSFPWWQGYALSALFIISAVAVIWAARVAARRLRQQEHQ